jgi:hypothetical protein
MGADAPTTLDITGEHELREGRRSRPAKYVLRAKKVVRQGLVLKLERDGKTAAEVPLQISPSTRASRCSPSTSTMRRARAVFRMSWGNRGPGHTLHREVYALPSAPRAEVELARYEVS